MTGICVLPISLLIIIIIIISPFAPSCILSVAFHPVAAGRDNLRLSLLTFIQPLCAENLPFCLILALIMSPPPHPI